MFRTHVPNMLKAGSKPTNRTIQEAFDSLSKPLQVARRPGIYFNAPVATAAEQCLLGAVGAGLGQEQDSQLWKFWQLFGGDDLSKTTPPSPDLADQLRSLNLPRPARVAFIGIGQFSLNCLRILHKGF